MNSRCLRIRSVLLNEVVDALLAERTENERLNRALDVAAERAWSPGITSFSRTAAQCLVYLAVGFTAVGAYSAFQFPQCPYDSPLL